MTPNSQQIVPAPFVDTVNFAARDENIRCLSYGVLRKHAGLPRDLFADYWRDVLGPLCARLPALQSLPAPPPTNRSARLETYPPECALPKQSPLQP